MTVSAAAMRELLSLPFAPLAIKTAYLSFCRPPSTAPLMPRAVILLALSDFAKGAERTLPDAGRDICSPLTFFRRTRHTGATNFVHSLTNALYSLADRTGGTPCFVKTAEWPTPIQGNSAPSAEVHFLPLPPHDPRQAREQSAAVLS
jgi:hypothetical protein